MTWIVGLFIGGLILIVFEVILPGGILGLFGFGAIVGSVIVAYQEYGGSGALVTGGIGLVVAGIVLYVEFKILPKTSAGKRFFLNKRIDGVSQKEVGSDIEIGSTGTAITRLSPTGMVLVDGKKLEAASKTGMIEKNEDVKVVGRETFRIVVSKLS